MVLYTHWRWQGINESFFVVLFTSLFAAACSTFHGARRGVGRRVSFVIYTV
jgi:hypothetical protein